jgi:uncharacterized SAM-binding protein YcdF (DUF218 family)
MPLWNRKKNWEDEYDEFYAQDRRTGEPGTRKKSTGLRLLAHFLMLLFGGAIFLGAAGSIGGRGMLEKILTDLAMPLGVVWLALILMVYFCLLTRQAWPAIVGFFCWITLTAAGNSYVSNWLISTLEAPYQSTNVLEMDPIDTAVILGGGTSSRLSGFSQVTMAGDRVVVGARLYHSGIIKNLICTGTNTFSSAPKDLNPRQEAAEILEGLGVPRENITQMKGKNTSEEMTNLKAWMDATPEHGQVGIITSAWHLPRALRLAENHGVELTPIPCNFLTEPYGPSRNLVVPGSYPLRVSTFAIKEYLAGFVNR